MKISKTNIYDSIIVNNRISQTIQLIALISILSVGNSYAHEDRHEQPSNSVKAEKTVQTECPVMVGNKIDPNIYVDYKGKRVYFCCNSCKSAFGKTPEKYLHRLPQFESTDTSGHNKSPHEHSSRLLILSKLIVPMGIVTLSLVAVTIFLSIFRRINVSLMMKWHKRTGIAVLIAGVIHAILVLIAH